MNINRNVSKQIAQPLEPVEFQQPNNQCKVCHLRKQCLPSCLNSDELNSFDDIVSHPKPIQSGERLFMAGDKIDSLFLLRSGSVKTYIESAGGDHQITCFHLSGNIIGVHGFENKVHNDTVEALETSSFCELPLNKLEKMTKTFPVLHSQFLQLIFKEMKNEQAMLLTLGKMTAQQRLAYFLLTMSQRMAQRGLSANSIKFTMTRHDIANHLGLAVETVSRVLTRFQQLEIVTVQRRYLTITNSQMLEHIYDNNSEASNQCALNN